MENRPTAVRPFPWQWTLYIQQMDCNKFKECYTKQICRRSFHVWQVSNQLMSFFFYWVVCWQLHLSIILFLGLSAIDSMKKSAAFHWTMDNHEDIKNLMSFDWGHAANGSRTVRGIRGKAVYVGYGACGAFTLSENLLKSCVFDASLCNSGFTLMLWLWYKIKDSGEGLVFLTSSGNNRAGHRMYQVRSDSPQVWPLIIFVAKPYYKNTGLRLFR